MLVFYPLDFSPVCTDQLSIYQEVMPEIEAKGVELVGISVDSQLRPQGLPGEARHSTSRCSPTSSPRARSRSAYGSYIEDVGHGNRSLVLIDEEGNVRVGARVAHARARSPAPT